ncbi:MAG: response regulator [Actinobacteria bacterium]|nr:response regulator [Actinomycetota bacterium]
MVRILVASDAASVYQMIAAAVESADVEVEWLQSGPALIESVRQEEPDLVVLDMQIASMGGMAVCMELRLDESAGWIDHVGVLMLLDRRADVFLAKRSSAEGWLVKPLDPIRIRRAVRALLDGETYHDESYQPSPVSVRGAA